MTSVADIMVAGDRPPADSEFVNQVGGEAEFSFDSGAIGSHITGMDHRIRMLVGDPCGEQRPIVDEKWLVPAQMRVGNRNKSHSAPPSVEPSHIRTATDGRMCEVVHTQRKKVRERFLHRECRPAGEIT